MWQPGIEGARIRITQKNVEPVPGTLGLRLDLKRIVSSRTSVGEVRDIVKLVGRCLWKSTAQVIVGVGKARRRRPDVHVQPVHQDVGAARSRIPRSQHDVARQLMLDVQVELLNHALLEVEILRLDSAKETGDVRRSRRRKDTATDGKSPADGTGLNSRSSGECRGRTGSWEP